MGRFKKYSAYLKLAFALGLFALVIHTHDLSGDYLIGKASSPLFWVSALVGNFLVSVLTTWRWQILLRRIGAAPVGFARLFLYCWISQFVGLAFLGTFGADFARGYFLNARESVALNTVTKSIVLDRVAGTVALALVAVAALPYYYGFSAPVAHTVALTALAASCVRVELLLSLLAHVTKIAIVATVLLLDGSRAETVGLLPHMALGLVIEGLPISWQGFGVGHAAFAALLKTLGIELYNGYFLGKTVFKLLGGFFLLGEEFRGALLRAYRMRGQLS